MTDMLETIKNRRAIRRYKADQITDEELNKILEAGIYAPSAGGGQRPVIVALQNRDLSAELGRINAAAMKRTKAGHVSSEQPSIIDDPSLPSGFYGAPTVCVIFSRENYIYSMPDSFCCAENMILEAADLNVASAIIGRAEQTFDTETGRKLMKEWDIPEDYIARCFVILGYIDGPYPSVKPRKEGRIRIVR
ncbi:MAG: nitroreductase family protein [Erysipelotrichaceae bacterium]|nr:nitroreductase family protein [Erysipelotrichaceae bacterium]